MKKLLLLITMFLCSVASTTAQNNSEALGSTLSVESGFIPTGTPNFTGTNRTDFNIHKDTVSLMLVIDDSIMVKGYCIREVQNMFVDVSIDPNFTLNNGMTATSIGRVSQYEMRPFYKTIGYLDKNKLPFFKGAKIEQIVLSNKITSL